MKKAKKLLEEKGIRVSIQRVKILQFIRDYSGHPSVDKIYRKLKEEIPTLSRTTVYNAMRIFEEKGIVRQLSVKDEEVCFDYITDNHAHFICNECGKIYDLEECIDYSEEEEIIEGHLVQSRCICYKGICEECSKEK